MKVVWEKVSEVIKKVAEFGAGTASMGASYEPKIPKKLIK